VNDRTALLGPQEIEVLKFLAILGVIVLLFRVGLESNLRGLLKHIRGSALIWLGNVSISALAGYLACRYLLGLDNVPSLVVGVAMTATSVAVPTSLLSGLALGIVLVVVAVLGKVVGTAAPSLLNCSWYGAVVLGVSMIPRAEITMVIMQRAHARGDWAVPESVYSGMVLVCAVTCIAAPWVLKSLLTSKTGQRVVEK